MEKARTTEGTKEHRGISADRYQFCAPNAFDRSDPEHSASNL